jgi:hypothetical protein
MKTRFATVAVALIVSLVGSLPVFASVQAGDVVKLTRPAPLHGTSGGEFLAEVDNNDVDALFNNGSFNTFCVQLSENISLGSSYKVLSVGTTTVSGGVQLGSFAAWLYTSYLNNGLGIVVDTQQEANTIQIGIWKSMGYLGNIGNSFSGINTTPIGTNWTSSLLSTFESAYAAAIAGSSWTGGAADNYGNVGVYTGDIKIMNLVTIPGNANAQDQLVRIPTPPGGGAPVPEPMSMVVWSFLALCVAGVSRRWAA